MASGEGWQRSARAHRWQTADRCHLRVLFCFSLLFFGFFFSCLFFQKKLASFACSCFAAYSDGGAIASEVRLTTPHRTHLSPSVISVGGPWGQIADARSHSWPLCVCCSSLCLIVFQRRVVLRDDQRLASACAICRSHASGSDARWWSHPTAVRVADGDPEQLRAVHRRAVGGRVVLVSGVFCEQHGPVLGGNRRRHFHGDCNRHRSVWRDTNSGNRGVLSGCAHILAIRSRPTGLLAGWLARSLASCAHMCAWSTSCAVVWSAIFVFLSSFFLSFFLVADSTFIDTKA